MKSFLFDKGVFTIQRIDFIYSKDVTVIDQRQFEAHFELYNGYVEKYNEISQKLRNKIYQSGANATYSQFRSLKRGETFALNGVILHELYFENIGASDDRIAENIEIMTKNGFSDFESWKEDFIATARASRGWVVFAYVQRVKKFMNISLDAHDVGNIELSYPILVLDVYEHAYFLQYGNKKNEYIEQFMENINWKTVMGRFDQLK